MKVFSIDDEQVILSDTPTCWAELRRYGAKAQLGAPATPPVEVVFCVVDGQADVAVNGATFHLDALQGVQIPAGMAWQATVGAGTKVLRVDSLHPNFTPARALMAPLAAPHRFAIADKARLVYTDYMRAAVLNFAAGYAADKHFHQDADEIFWFFSGSCRVVTPEGEIIGSAGTIVYTAPGEWHIIENAGQEPLLMFLTVTPNIVPSHTFFDADGNPVVRSWEPLRQL